VTAPDELVLWRRADRPGHEAARVAWHHPFWQIGGTAVFVDDDEPCRIDYLMVCDERWRTSHARITGWVGARHLRMDVTVDGHLRWRVSGVECPAVAGCRDLDLSFSPTTHVVAIRRLELAVGQDTLTRAARLRLPDLALVPIDQAYRRISERTYHYQAFGRGFEATIEVDDRGMVVHCPGLWERESYRGG
jgi:uncharacterized protein